MFALWYLVLGYKEYKGYRKATANQLSNNEEISNQQSEVKKTGPVIKPDMKLETFKTKPTEPVKTPERPKAQESKPTEPVKIPERPKEPESKPTEPVKTPERPKAQESKPTEPVKIPEGPKGQESKPTEPVKIPEGPKGQESKPTEPVKTPEADAETSRKAGGPKRESPEAAKPGPGSRAPFPGARNAENNRPEGAKRGAEPFPMGRADNVNPRQQGEFGGYKQGNGGFPEQISRDDEMLGRKPGRSAGVNGAGPRQDQMDPKNLSYANNERDRPERGRKSNSRKGERSAPSPDSLDGNEKSF